MIVTGKEAAKLYIRNPYYAFTFRITALTLCISGIFRHLSFTDISHNHHMFSFFTIQSNLLCTILFFFFVSDTFIEMLTGSTYPYRYNHSYLRGVCLSSIFVTFLIFQFVLKRTAFSMYSGVNGKISTNDIFVHYIVPFLTLSDWIFFQPKGQWNWHQPLQWLIMPFCYFNLTMIRGLFITNSYPYFFLDINTAGIGKFLFYSFILLLIYTILSFIFTAADRFLYLITVKSPYHK